MVARERDVSMLGGGLLLKYDGGEMQACRRRGDKGGSGAGEGRWVKVGVGKKEEEYGAGVVRF